MLQAYVYRNLNLYGNTVLSRRTYDFLGETSILRELKRRGFECIIEFIPYPNDALTCYFDKTHPSPTIIIRVREVKRWLDL